MPTTKSTAVNQPGNLSDLSRRYLPFQQPVLVARLGSHAADSKWLTVMMVMQLVT